MMRSGQTDDVFGVNRPSVLHRHDDAWFSEFIIFASHLNLYTLHKALRCLYPQRLRKDIGWKLCKKSKYLQLWQCKHLPSNGLRTEKCSFSHDYTEGSGIITESHYDNPPAKTYAHRERLWAASQVHRKRYSPRDSGSYGSEVDASSVKNKKTLC